MYPLFIGIETLIAAAMPSSKLLKVFGNFAQPAKGKWPAEGNRPDPSFTWASWKKPSELAETLSNL